MHSVSELKKDDLKAVAQIHFDSMPTDSLPMLGKNFLEKVFYKGLLTSTYGKTIVARHNGEIAGFVCVSGHPSLMIKKILFKNFFKCVWYGSAGIFRSKKMIFEAFELILNIFKFKETNYFI